MEKPKSNEDESNKPKPIIKPEPGAGNASTEVLSMLQVNLTGISTSLLKTFLKSDGKDTDHAKMDTPQQCGNTSNKSGSKLLIDLLVSKRKPCFARLPPPATNRTVSDLGLHSEMVIKDEPTEELVIKEEPKEGFVVKEEPKEALVIKVEPSEELVDPLDCSIDDNDAVDDKARDMALYPTWEIKIEPEEVQGCSMDNNDAGHNNDQNMGLYSTLDIKYEPVEETQDDKGTTPNSEHILKMNGTSETQHISANLDFPRPFMGANTSGNNYVPTKNRKINIKRQSKEGKISVTDVFIKQINDSVIVTSTNEIVDGIFNKAQANVEHDKNINSGSHSAQQYSCSKCNFKINKARLFKSHLRKHLASNKYICDFCSYIATKKYRLICHMGIHTGVKPFACKLCNKKFTQVGNLKSHHMRNHTDKKPYTCEICKKSFSHAASLSRHAKEHLGEPSTYFPCEVCNKNFTRVRNLNRHIRIHTGDRPYVCKICGKKFADKDNLRRHVRIHTGEKPHACEICDKKFSMASDLKKHVRIHTGEKPYACKICNQKFARNSTLNSHVRIHTNENPRTKASS